MKPVARRVERGKEDDEGELDDLGGEGEEVLMDRFEEEEEGNRTDRGLIVDLARRRVGET